MANLGTVLIGGGTGFIGTCLANLLRNKGYGVTLVSRMPGPQRISWTELTKTGLPENVTAVVNLAGQNVLDPSQRWTPGFKQNVWSSRVNTTTALARAIVRAEDKPRAFVCISGVGIYEPHPHTEYTEQSRGSGFDFLSKLCLEWEDAARLPADLGVRTAVVRSGVVLGRSGGMIKQIYLPFYLGLGGRIGSGEQWMPWIHVADLTNLLLFAIENDRVQGVLNGVAPEVVTNKQFTESLGKAMWRPTLFPVPVFALNLAFSEERAKIMTEGQRVVPERTLKYGFRFRFPDIRSACAEVAAPHARN